jgi:L-asparaginase
LPVGEVRTDAKENLITAIEIAATTENGKSVIPEVCVYFDYLLFRGNRVSKVNASKFEAFQSVNFPPLAEAGVHLKFNRHLMFPYSGKKLIAHTSLSRQVGVVRIFPGMSREWFAAQLNINGIRAIVFETFGSGNAPSSDWFIDELQKAIKRGLVVVNITQCHGGTVEQGVYATSTRLQALGVIGGGDLTTESALTKLMFLCGNYHKVIDIKRFMSKSLRGELSQ